MKSRTSTRSIAAVELAFRWTAPLALVAFLFAVFTDWAYYGTAQIQYSNASAWLIFVGLIAAGVTVAIVGLSLLGGWSSRGSRWLAFVLFVVGFVVEVINFMVHNRDGWTTVVPTGFTLSVIGALLLMIAAWIARTPLGRSAR